MAKKTPEKSKLNRSTVAPYTRTSSSDTNFVVAKSDKTEKKVEAKAEKAEKSESKKGESVEERPHDGAPKPGDGAKSATANELPTEPQHRDTIAMTTVPLGTPPELPASVEDPTQMPGPRAIPGGDPTDPALPPGHVPPGDSRSFRRGHEFALVYRQANAVIVRFGTVGQRGQWRVVEYPTTTSASHAYARECSRFVSDGFSDYR